MNGIKLKTILRDIVREELDKVSEADQPSDADIDKGKMHNVLDIPEDEEVEDHYSSGQQLANDLENAVGQTDAVRMVTWAYNMTDKELYRVAKDALKKND